MCDDLTEADNARFAADGLSRRAFGTAAAAVGISVLLPSPANALAVKGRDVTIKTPDGTVDAYFVAPASGRHPAVLVWPDIYGLRPAFRQMADRLAASGYTVLTVNPFYRSTTAAALAASGDRTAVRTKAGEARKLLTPQAAVTDATAFVAFLDKQAQVDTKRGVGTTGYCMGGPLVMQTAAAVPGRIRAGGTFHGGGMASEPMLALIPQMKAGFLVAIAENDDARAPGDKDKLRVAFDAAKRPAEIEVYKGTMHGWCPPDSEVYNQVQAERAWARLLHLFETTL
ncbi:dienelactone hydrolase family protein [Sphingomonas sp. M1-B02]|uniref:dienelactone hydrolase family protein n=1 Tax=Sphingomonas sp. M1-B02 TaxID=3114300 RepID=UPI0022409695|nr:dienelactone hydrolase family protein [Sphingomonas sp. S6-11]UZK67590.1 dienelactone hydrolase family protein [Sphingomonas sp. S6-11]